MKPIKDMSPSEVQQLVAYTTAAGTSIYYSDITHINADSILYNDELLPNLSPVVVDSLKSGKARYEAYRLLMTPQEVSTFINNQVDTLVADRIERAIQATAEPLTATMQQLASEMISTKQSVSDMRNAVSSIESFLPAAFSEEMKNKYETVHTNLLQAETDFKLVNNQLKSLLVIEE